MAENQKVLSMYFAGGEFPDMYPWEFTLEEGLSRLYRGEMTAISDKKHTAAELAGLVDKNVSVTMRETLEDKKTVRSRSFHGVITSAGCSGVFCSAAMTDCYTYTFVIEPELARLRHTRFSAPYYRMNPVDIFERILGAYKIKLQIRDNYLSRGKFGKNLMFNQTDTPALDFIERIAGMYGISYTFTHPVTDGCLGNAELYFSDGERFPVSAVVYSDNRKVPETLSFDFLAADEGNSLWRMQEFRVGNGIGADGVLLAAMYPNANYGSDNWKRGKADAGGRFKTYSGLFHGYDRSVSTDEVDADIGLILAARLRAEAQVKSFMAGGAANITLLPGTILELAHFYGKRDNAVITALVTGIKLKLRARWRQDLAVRPEGVGGELTELRFDCIDWGKDAEKRFCPAFSD
jgi:hypothetical protein